VGQLQSAFMDNWNIVHPEVLHGESYFPSIPPAGSSLAQVFKSSPEEGSGSVRLMYLYAVAHAKQSIRIASAYFVPDSHLRKLLVDAQKRGVQIEVILPGTKTDVAITRMASRAVWDSLLAAGIKIYEYQSTMYHCKFMIVDEVWVSVGSTNLDSRSFRLNDECNLNVIDREWAKSLVVTFNRDRVRSREISRKNWRKRSLSQKTLEWASSLFESQI
jgi:cardiolipin synthase